MEHHQDEHITCAECGTTFVFTAAEADSFASKRLEPPKRCPECRRARRAQKAAGGHDAGPPRGHFGGDVNGYRSPMSDPSGRRGGGSGEYRAPGFRDSRPSEGHRQATGPNSGGRGEYRAPGFGGNEAPRGNSDYRAPAFAGDRGPRGGGEYRAPGFGGDRGPRRDGEYRAPSFGGNNDRGARGGAGEYRAPSFGGSPDRPSRDRGPRPPQHDRGPRSEGGPRRGPGGAPRGEFRSSRGPGPRPQEGGGQAQHRPERPSYPITCAQCGVAAEVPFKPQEGREILCRDCYRAKKDAAG